MDPTKFLSEDDPLRDWAKNLDQDPVLGTLLLTDPQAAIDRMVAKGVPPPNTSSYAPTESSMLQGEQEPPALGPTTAPAAATVPAPTPSWQGGVPPTSIFGRLGIGQQKAGESLDPTADQGPHRLAPAAATEKWRKGTPLPTQVSSASPLDPQETVPPTPVPAERPVEAGPG